MLLPTQCPPPTALPILATLTPRPLSIYGLTKPILRLEPWHKHSAVAGALAGRPPQPYGQTAAAGLARPES
ncbi:hypothetical protein GCM10010515_57140 [Streptomyces fructofermentans]|uniref:Uncharacterized protein n=1 Tax=Streptomyces fructofermentans TaxID=152141 RepID=A0A918NMV7_9ACTN|nr:hypothetical protein GCM10010515_57140 [Streptomyces fructofermentans]